MVVMLALLEVMLPFLSKLLSLVVDLASSREGGLEMRSGLGSVLALARVVESSAQRSPSTDVAIAKHTTSV
eukprot:CAMPEP_0169403762 /NCGR_PEP_ID=MMETSP1017-20121227/55957_1 /TAXON_ID=342587 /ORGANISM="Karlodinium micrum, Strain CCMP2283" /LENGTH=70 /DNA_ID=CAMNT_0009510055 /DNA_START=66 /DNA_END=274 /DNA_ORIENTATION=-